MALGEYRRKRDFSRTAEPRGEGGKADRAGGGLTYVVQKHQASHLHYDLRLESEGVLRSWAVPKGPSMSPADRRLAVAVEDHPLDYASFEGVIPEGEYGAGTVIVWDRGTYRPRDPHTSLDVMLHNGSIKIDISGKKLKGGFVLVRTRQGGGRNWLLIKEKDASARPGSDITAEQPRSVISNRDVDEVT